MVDSALYVANPQLGGIRARCLRQKIRCMQPMDTTSTVKPSSEPVLLILGILKSYEHMGQAVMACESGCTCQPLKFDGHHMIRESVTKHARHSSISRTFPPCPHEKTNYLSASV